MSKNNFRILPFFVLVFLSILTSVSSADLGCPAVILNLQDETIATGQVINQTARNLITVGPNYIVSPYGTVTLAAPIVTLLPGFSAQENSSVRVTSDHHHPLDVVNLQDETIATGQVINRTASNLMTVGPNYIVNRDGSVTLGAQTVTLLPGFSAQEGSSVRITSDHHHPPIGFEDNIHVEENGTVSGNVLSNDAGFDCDSLSAQQVSAPSNGTLEEFNADGTFTYTHSGDETTHDQFTYKAIDTFESKEVTVFITITPINDAPIAHNDLFTIDMDTTKTLNVLGNDIDVDYGDVLNILSVDDQSIRGGVTNNSSSLTYTPEPGFIGPETFSYTAQDSGGATSTATITVNVVDAPVCTTDLELSNQTITGTVDITHRNSIKVGPAYTVTSGASLKLTSHDTISLQPGFKAEQGSTINLVGLPWDNLNAEPIAEADSYIVNEGEAVTANVLVNDRDLECDPLTAVLVSQPSHGTLGELNIGDSFISFTYQHDSSETTHDSFTYQAKDAELSNIVTVSITVNPMNDAPVANDDTYYMYYYASVLLDVLANDFDVDPGDTLTISSVSQPDQGRTDTDGNTVTYTPPANLIGMENFTYTVQDGNGEEATVTVYIGNTPPEAIAQSVITNEFQPIQIVLTGSDYDYDQLSYELTSDPERGAISGTPPFITYSPQVVPSGQVSFTFTVSDPFYTSPPATVSITVNYVEKEWLTSYQYDDLGRITGKTVTISPVGN